MDKDATTRHPKTGLAINKPFQSSFDQPVEVTGEGIRPRDHKGGEARARSRLRGHSVTSKDSHGATIWILIHCPAAELNCFVSKSIAR